MTAHAKPRAGTLGGSNRMLSARDVAAILAVSAYSAFSTSCARPRDDGTRCPYVANVTLMFRWPSHAATYPQGSGEPDWLGSLQPDRLAELHTVRELVASPELSQACLTSLDSRQARGTVTLLARASSVRVALGGVLKIPEQVLAAQLVGASRPTMKSATSGKVWLRRASASGSCGSPVNRASRGDSGRTACGIAFVSALLSRGVPITDGGCRAGPAVSVTAGDCERERAQ